MDVQKNVPFNPRVRAVQIQNVIAAAGEDVVVELNDRLVRPVAAGEVHDVVVAARAPKKTLAHDAAPARLDAASSMHEFKGRRARRENAVADEERTAVERKVLHWLDL